jgi:hypothetical protein
MGTIREAREGQSVFCDGFNWIWGEAIGRGAGGRDADEPIGHQLLRLCVQLSALLDPETGTTWGPRELADGR